jgi:O-antigen/teichoic acid export membrane protein
MRTFVENSTLLLQDPPEGELADVAEEQSVKLIALAPLSSDSLAWGVALLLASTVLQRVVGFARELCFCRWLSPEHLGLWDMGFGFLMLAGPLVVMSLPGTFGRYAERYRQRGLLRQFLQRTALFCACTSLPAIGLIVAARGSFSHLIFGTPQHADMIVYLAAGLATVVAFNYLICLITALRNMRLVSLVELVNSVLFGVLGIGLLATGHTSARAMIVAYGASCLVSVLIGLAWLSRAWKSFPHASRTWATYDIASEIWTRLIPLAAWTMAINFLWNLFDVVDRYMILHLSPGSAAEALAEVGNYRSSRVLPLLLSSITIMIAGATLPHLTHDWESGRRGNVSNQLNLLLKVWAFALTAGAAVVLLFAPVLFRIGFQSKFTGGLHVLPLTLTYCTWFGLSMLLQTYLWCAEKAAWASLVALTGVIINVLLNLLLLPTMGLPGAVLATAIANMVAVVFMAILCRRCGFQIDRGTWIALSLPAAIPFGPCVIAAALALMVLSAVATDEILSQDEKRNLWAGLRHYVDLYFRRVARDEFHDLVASDAANEQSC